MGTDSVNELLHQVVGKWQPAAAIGEVLPITPDASTRRYYRLQLDDAPVEQLVAMVFDSVSHAEIVADGAVATDEACVELTEFFSRTGVPVPELYFDGRSDGVLLIEDVGELQLADATNKLAAKDVDNLYCEAVDWILHLQKMEVPQDHFLTQRVFDRELYLKEIDEIIDYAIGREEGACLLPFFDEIASYLDALPRVLVHRDYHSWNLLVDKAEKVRIIDFQDALLAPRTYDLVALLNDRDTDALLGEKRYQMLVDYFKEQSSYGEEFFKEYYSALLQRDIKVVGRFSKLSKERGLSSYERWIPGTLRRIGKTLARIPQSSTAKDAISFLSERFPELKAAYES